MARRSARWVSAQPPVVSASAAAPITAPAVEYAAAPPSSADSSAASQMRRPGGALSAVPTVVSPLPANAAASSAVSAMRWSLVLLFIA